jgi:hypothetical protein
MNKLFTIAGTSTLNGVNTYRFATGKLNIRVSKLKRHGHTDVQLMSLPNPMIKKDAVAWLVSQGISAAIPRTGRGANKVAELTPEQADAAAAAAAQLIAAAEARAAQDAEYVAGLTGDAEITLPSEAATENADVHTDADNSDTGFGELLDAISGEVGVDADREIADEMQST